MPNFKYSAFGDRAHTPTENASSDHGKPRRLFSAWCVFTDTCGGKLYGIFT